jgi:hypothetical protein
MVVATRERTGRQDRLQGCHNEMGSYITKAAKPRSCNITITYQTSWLALLIQALYLGPVLAAFLVG